MRQSEPDARDGISLPQCSGQSTVPQQAPCPGLCHAHVNLRQCDCMYEGRVAKSVLAGSKKTEVEY